MSFLRWPLMILALLYSLSGFAQEGTAGVSMVENAIDNGYLANWNVSFFSIGSLTQQQMEKGGSSFSAYNYLGGNYRISKTKRFSIRPVFFFNTSGYSKYNEYQTQGASLGDMHLVYSDYEMSPFPDSFELDVSTSFKFYLPTSENSQRTRMILQFRPETYITRKIGKFSSVSWVLKPDIFVQSQTAYLDDTTPKFADGKYRFDPRKTTKMAALEHYIEFNASMSQFFSIKPAFGFSEDWYNSSSAEGLDGSHTTSAKLALAFDFRVARKVTFTLGLENKPKLSNLRDDVAFFRPEDNGAFLMTNASL